MKNAHVLSALYNNGDECIFNFTRLSHKNTKDFLNLVIFLWVSDKLQTLSLSVSLSIRPRWGWELLQQTEEERKGRAVDMAAGRGRRWWG